MPPLLPVPLDDMVARLEGALNGSPADATELVWIETRRVRENGGSGRDGDGPEESRESCVLVRVRESGRTGLHRIAHAEPSALEDAVRMALAQARLSPPAPEASPAAREETPELPADLPAEIPAADLHDPEVAGLTPGRARELVQGLAGQGETVRLGWAEGRVAVVNSRGLRRAAAVTSVFAAVSRGRGTGAGQAAGAARTLAGLALPALLARARERQAPPDLPAAAAPDGPAAVVLSQEAAAALLDLLNQCALTSISFHDGTSALRGALGEPVFHPAVSLRDDGTRAGGLPFPFDLLGAAKRPVDLVDRGVFLTPAVDERLGRELGLPPTPHLVAPDEAAAGHLFLLPGGPAADSAELLRAAEGGLWIGSLDAVAGSGAPGLRFRAVARGVRRVESGALGAAVPDLIWEDDLQSLLARVLGVGAEPVTVAVGDGLFGGITAPMLALDRVSGLGR